MSILPYSLNDNYVHNQNLIFTKIVIANFQKITKIIIYVLRRNSDDERCLKKPGNKQILNNFRLNHFKFKLPTV